ncbi:MAG TPA: hypothetical protein VKZ39_02900 [Sphaerochaetaceae bacterium]|nr:hypothetical protein [Sphaerochaetaceae bacterium]
MSPEKIPDYTFSFSIGTPIITSHRALDRLPSILSSLGMDSPLWVIPEDALQKRTLSALVNTLFGREYLGKQSPVVQVPTAHTGSEYGEAKLKEPVSTYNGVVVCGDSEIARAGRVYAERGKVPMILIPFGQSDTSEYTGGEDGSIIPSQAVVDGRLTRLATPIGTARSICFALLQVCTALLETSNPMMVGTAQSAFFYAHQALERLVDSANNRVSWVECTLSSAAAEHAAGICAQNRTNHAVLDFAERLAIPGLADRFQSAGALLPYVCMRLKRERESAYNVMQEAIMGMDPIEFTKAWLSLSDPKGTDRIIHYLCGDMHDLLTHPRNVRELLPLLTLFPGKGGEQ